MRPWRRSNRSGSFRYIIIMEGYLVPPLRRPRFSAPSGPSGIASKSGLTAATPIGTETASKFLYQQIVWQE